MCVKKTQNFVKSILLLVSFFFREADLSNMGRFFFSLARNLVVQCLFCVLYGFSCCGPFSETETYSVLVKLWIKYINLYCVGLLTYSVSVVLLEALHPPTLRGA